MAPIWDSTQNETSRAVWIPPGTWHDAWTGARVVGPRNVTTAAQPYERQPMWHRAGGLLVTTSRPGTRVSAQDWSELTLEAWPDVARAQQEGIDGAPLVERRSVRALGTAAKTALAMTTRAGGNGTVTLRLEVSAADDGAARAWVLRAHLAPGQRVTAATVDGARVAPTGVAHLAPVAAGGAEDAGFFPLRGAGRAPPARAGPVAELRVPRGASARVVELQILG